MPRRRESGASAAARAFGYLSNIGSRASRRAAGAAARAYGALSRMRPSGRLSFRNGSLYYNTGSGGSGGSGH